tara:strand:+ start:340 stop:1155 length:816 start_codon:yes stop_codon:yes gene_type:complete
MSQLGPYASYNAETGYAVQISPTSEYVGIFERINIQPKGVIHIGLWDFCELFCYTKLVGKNIIGIEGDPRTYKYMSKPMADKWGVPAFNECITNTDGEDKQFYMDREGSSFFQGRPEFGKVNSIPVKTKSLSKLVEENNIDMNEYDFLNMDAEGAELDILQGFEKYLDYINVIDMETSFEDKHLNGCTHDAIVKWLTARGFVLREMSASYQREGQGDSVFVRRDREQTPFKGGNMGDEIWGKGYLEKHCEYQEMGSQQFHWQNNTPGFIAL